MPIYEYQCEKCHHHLEALQKIADKPLRECPECGKHTLKRLVSAPLFRLAGSGWYETDFKSDKETKRNLAGKDEAPAADAKDSGDKSTSKAEQADKPGKPDKAEKSAATGGKAVVSKPAPATAAARSKSKPAAKRPSAKRVVKKR
jgi:putative FmdB family regulatory protein